MYLSSDVEKKVILSCIISILVLLTHMNIVKKSNFTITQRLRDEEPSLLMDLVFKLDWVALWLQTINLLSPTMMLIHTQ